MAEIITIATRRISGTGQIQPTAEELKHRRYTLYSDIIRKPITPYFNRKYEPPQTFYGYLSFMNQGYLLHTLAIKYDSQIWIFDADISGQNLIAIKCEYKGILQTFFNLGNSLNLPSLSVENTINDYKFLPLKWDNIIVKCDGDSAIQFVLKALPYDSCDDNYKDPASSPEPPTKPEPVPPGTATEISVPYPNDTITSPSPIDGAFIPATDPRGCPGVWSLLDNWTGFPQFEGVDNFAGYQLDYPEWRRTAGSSVAWELYAAGTDGRIMFSTPGINAPQSTLFYSERSFAKTNPLCVSPPTYIE